MSDQEKHLPAGEKDSKSQAEPKDVAKPSVEETTTQQGGVEKPEKSNVSAAKKVVEKAESSARDDKSASSAPRPAAAGKARPTPAARPRAKAQEEEKPLEPSHRQPLLDQFVATIQEKVTKEAVVESYINRANDHLPTLVISQEHWLEVARCLKEEESLAFDYVRNYSGVDYETHLEVVVHLTSFTHSHHIGVRVKTDREEATLPSISSIWSAADWNEREVYDLLGIRFEGHPNLKRILMPDDWVGHPLRKDYEPLDKEV